MSFTVVSAIFSRLSALVTVAGVLAIGSVPALADETRTFMRVETKTLDGQQFDFPDDLRAPSVNVVLLAIGTERRNVTWQGEALIEWYDALQSAGVLSDGILAWHLSVTRVPFFAKGLIRSGMAERYAGRLPPGQTAPLLVRDVEAFAEKAGIPVDGQPTIVLVAPGGVINVAHRGELTEQALAEVLALCSRHAGAAGTP